MKLLCCEECGVVVNINFMQRIHSEDYPVWDKETEMHYYDFYNCPICIQDY